MNKKKVLVLGTVQGEVPLVKAFQELGYYVITVGQNENYPCCKIADKNIIADIMDKEKILQIAKDEEIVAITSNVVERAIRVVAWVAEKMSLEGIGYEISKTFTNKFLMREVAGRIGINCPRYACATCVEDALKFAHTVTYPLMIKPVDNGGSKGVTKVYCDQELIDNFEHSIEMSVEDKMVIIEEFIDGTEYIVDAFTHDYVCDNTNVSTKETFDLRDYCIVKNVVLQDAGSCSTRIERLLLHENKKLVEGMNLKFGITHANYIYNKIEDKVYLVEITSRGGGDYISSDLVELATGINVSKLLAQYSLGEKPIKENGLAMKKGAAAWFGFALPQGVIKTVVGIDETEKIQGVYKVVHSNFYVGKKVERLVELCDKCGPILVYGQTRSECYSIMEQVKKVLKVTVDTVDGEKTMIW